MSVRVVLVHLQQRVHAVVDGDVQATDLIHDGLGDDDVRKCTAASCALEKVYLMNDAIGVENWKRRCGRVKKRAASAVQLAFDDRALPSDACISSWRGL